ncbi:MAG: dihydrodipicolinate synthase family protein [Opitutaceae bacterium]|nr:dihydrodipicolinate synthase family protein [Opitutaceae bacterium]
MSKKLTTKSLSRAQLRGFSIVPMLTPFTAAGALDEAAARRHVEHVVTAGSQGLLIAGTTGEAVSMPLEMRIRYTQLAIEQVRGRAVVFGGIGDNSLAHSVALTRAYFAAGADAVVAHLPSYYPIGGEEMEYHFRSLADRIEGPLYLYNIPQTTKHSIPLDVIERLSHHPRIAGIKDSEPDVERQVKLAGMFRGRTDFAVFAGMIAATSKAMRAGADGFVPSAGNIAPRAARELMDRLVAGDEAGADAAQRRIDAISLVYQKGRTVPQSMAAMKACLALLGVAERHMLPPLRAVDDATVEQLRAGLREQGLLP